jgi:hypothetical protein
MTKKTNSCGGCLIMNKTDNKLVLLTGEDGEDGKIGRKPIEQIVEELRSRGINAEVCKRV